MTHITKKKKRKQKKGRRPAAAAGSGPDSWYFNPFHMFTIP